MATQTDNFERIDSADLGTNWDPNTSTWRITANQAQVANAGADAVETWNANTFNNDQFSEATLSVFTGVGTNDQSGVGFGVRWAAGVTKTGYWLICNEHATLGATVARFDAGAYTFLAQRDADWVQGDLARLEISGQNLAVRKNGTQVGSAISDPGGLASGRVALTYSSTADITPSLDNWQGGDLGGVVDNPRPRVNLRPAPFAPGYARR